MPDRHHPLPFSDQRFARAELERIQLGLLNDLIARARVASAFHRHRLPAEPLGSLDELTRLPFMVPDDLRVQESVLLVPPQQVSRMVSLPTSGTSGEPKRIAFTEEDVRQTREFFSTGLHCICRAGEPTAVLFPSATPGSMGSLIAMSVEDTGARAATFDISAPLEEIARAVARSGATSAVGSGHLLLALARYAGRHPGTLGLDRVLVSSDNASRSMLAAIGTGLGCEVFEHFGMTETGFGCAVDCWAHAGMHIREFDMIVEIVDPATGEAVPAGEEGELVITTLLREAMPVIRYRTGDIASIVPGECPCGGGLRRLGRMRGHALLRDDGEWRLEAALDETVFALPGVVDYEARLTGMNEGRSLSIAVESFEGIDARELKRALPEDIAVEVEAKPVDESAPLRNPKLSRLQ
ncbi:MAG: DVU_1553 family AMP-dependent CoA ligase [Coriobacteriales bacterium]|jgi:phenylacetate-CoA ligase